MPTDRGVLIRAHCRAPRDPAHDPAQFAVTNFGAINRNRTLLGLAVIGAGLALAARRD